MKADGLRKRDVNVMQRMKTSRNEVAKQVIHNLSRFRD